MRGGGGGLNTPEKTKNDQLVYGKIVINNDQLIVSNSKFSDTDIIKQDHEFFAQDIQVGVQDYTPEFVTNAYHLCGPGFDNYPQAPDYKVIVDNISNFSSKGQLSTGVFVNKLEADLQSVMEGFNTNNDTQCVALQALVGDSRQCGLGFEYYPQVPQCELSTGNDKNCINSNMLSTITLKYDHVMDLQPLIKVFDAEYIHSHTAVVCNLDEHGGIGGNVNSYTSGKQGAPKHNGILQVTNFSSCYNDTWVPIVHVQGGKSSHLSGFYLWIQGPWGRDGTLDSLCSYP